MKILTMAVYLIFLVTKVMRNIRTSKKSKFKKVTIFENWNGFKEKSIRAIHNHIYNIIIVLFYDYFYVCRIFRRGVF